jgi:hypothetical protein
VWVVPKSMPSRMPDRLARTAAASDCPMPGEFSDAANAKGRAPSRPGLQKKIPRQSRVGSVH